MGELGKICVAAAIVSCLPQAARDHEGEPLAPDLRLALWGGEGETVFAEPPTSSASLVPQGAARVESLIAALEHERTEAPLRALLLSDGALPPKDAGRLGTWLKTSGVQMRALAIGADADHALLEAICGRHNVYAPQDLVEAARWRDLKPEAVRPPAFAGEIVWPSPPPSASGADNGDG